QKFFRRLDMELIDVQHVPTKGGSLRYTVQTAGGTRIVSPAVEELIGSETKLGTDSLPTFKAFASKIDGVKRQLLSLLSQLMEEGKTIAGYGASATTTTLIYHYELNDYLRFIVDDYSAKQGLLSP